MNEMADDIRAAAVSVYSRYLKDIGSLSLVDLLAEALMAERERCVKIAWSALVELELKGDAEYIAAAIRAPAKEGSP